MDLKGKRKQGMRIFGSDDREYGTIERYDDDSVYVGGRKVPYSAFERMDKGRLYVGQSGSRYFGDSRESRELDDQDQLRVQVAEERLSVDKRATELGAVNIHKTVETEQVSVPVDLMREAVNVQEVDVADRALSTAEASGAFQETTIRVPVHGEEAVAHKSAVMTGEVVIDRERVTEQRTISDTVRRERVDVDENYRKDRPNLEQHFVKSGRADVGSGKRTLRRRSRTTGWATRRPTTSGMPIRSSTRSSPTCAASTKPAGRRATASPGSTSARRSAKATSTRVANALRAAGMAARREWTWQQAIPQVAGPRPAGTPWWASSTAPTTPSGR
jgi:uncharacterized protein (TIGR02271 family)